MPFNSGLLATTPPLTVKRVRRGILPKIADVLFQLGEGMLIKTTRKRRGQRSDDRANGADNGGFLKRVQKRLVIGPRRAAAQQEAAPTKPR